MAKAKREIIVKIKFTEDDVQALLNAANFGSEGARQLDELTGKQFAALKAEIQSTPFVEELVDTSYDACANDWLWGWGAPDDEDEAGSIPDSL